MRRVGTAAVVIGAVVMWVATAEQSWADAWDRSVPGDGGIATRSELVHGSDELHDLQSKGSKPDEDWYRIDQEPFSSYEILVESTAGEIGAPIVERIAADGTTVLQTAVGIGAIGFTRSLRWRSGATAVTDQYVRVRSGACVKCKKDALYRIRAFDTTCRVARFNNTGTQVTVLIVQNPTNATVSGDVYFWTAAGAAAGTVPFVLDAKDALVSATSSVAPGVSGTITIANDGRYGDLAGKATSLEPATGFSFDTLLEPRPK